MDKNLHCPLCGSSKNDKITDTVRFDYKADVHRCDDCSLTFLDQQSFDYPDDFYEKEYHQTYITHVEPDALDPKVYFEKMKKATSVWADLFKSKLNGTEVVLDVGCSTGHFIELIQDSASKVYGHELSEKEVHFCQYVLNLEVSDQPLEKRFKPGTFDYITLIFVLEHISDPKTFLKDLQQYLKPDGKFVILVPNIQDALVNFYDLPEFRSFYYCIEHLYYYNQQTISKLFEDIGLTGQVEVLQEYPITNHLNWGYLRKPSDTLAARLGIPSAQLMENAPVEEWQNLWKEFNQMYLKFLTSNGYGDRLWCTVGPGKK